MGIHIDELHIIFPEGGKLQLPRAVSDQENGLGGRHKPPLSINCSPSLGPCSPGRCRASEHASPPKPPDMNNQSPKISQGKPCMTFLTLFANFAYGKQVKPSSTLLSDIKNCQLSGMLTNIISGSFPSF